jgi:uncharacterized peroxidase-related enzyme
MPRLEPLPDDAREGLEEVIEGATRRLGFTPNSLMTMGRRPDIALAFNRLANVIMGPTSTVDVALRNLISQVASRSAGCGYCMAHTANGSLSCGLSSEKEDALWDYETSPLFTPAERAALRVADGAGRAPNEVSDEDFEQLRKHYSAEQIVDIVAVIAMFGFLNRWNDTMATELESEPKKVGERVLSARGWSVGKHGL